MPMEPLIFVEVALTRALSGNIQELLDESAPVLDTSRADTAIFYSISNTQPGLRGVTFGNFLLKRVIDDLKRDFPCLLYTSDAADERSSVDLGGRRIIKKKHSKHQH